MSQGMNCGNWCLEGEMSKYTFRGKAIETLTREEMLEALTQALAFIAVGKITGWW